MLYCFFFFFQAEDGIRDYKVTGVQTCALPISGTPPAGAAVSGTVRSRSAEIDGTPPGSEIRRKTSRPGVTLSTPTKNPCVAPGSSLSTPCGLAGPGPELVASCRKAVTVKVPASRSALLIT